MKKAIKLLIATLIVCLVATIHLAYTPAALAQQDGVQTQVTQKAQAAINGQLAPGQSTIIPNLYPSFKLRLTNLSNSVEAVVHVSVYPSGGPVLNTQIMRIPPGQYRDSTYTPGAKADMKLENKGTVNVQYQV